MNELRIIGFLTSDPQKKTSAFGPYCYFTVAAARRKPKPGESNCIYYQVFVNREYVDPCMQNLKNGSLISITGEFDLKSRMNGDQVQLVPTISLDRVEFLDKFRTTSKAEKTPAQIQEEKKNTFTFYEDDNIDLKQY